MTVSCGLGPHDDKHLVKRKGANNSQGRTKIWETDSEQPLAVA